MVSLTNYTAVSWRRAISRCHSSNDPDYWRYGGRGIVVCDRWRRGFAAFLQDMGLRPPNHTLDRVDSTKNYEKGNCRWADSKVQNRHARHMITHGGMTMALGEWAELLNIKQTTLSMRLKNGWSVERAFQEPVQH